MNNLFYYVLSRLRIVFDMPECNLHEDYSYNLFICKHIQTSAYRYLKLYNPCPYNHNSEGCIWKLKSPNDPGFSKIKSTHQRNWNGNKLCIVIKQHAFSGVIFCCEWPPYLHLACVDCSVHWSAGCWAEPWVNKVIYND